MVLVVCLFGFGPGLKTKSDECIEKKATSTFGSLHCVNKSAKTVKIESNATIPGKFQ
jgi:hypothetical protein